MNDQMNQKGKLAADMAKLIGFEEQYEKVIHTIIEQQLTLMISMVDELEGRPEAEKMKSLAIREVMAEISLLMKPMMDEVITQIADAHTLLDLKNIVSFLQSPSGKRMIETQRHIGETAPTTMAPIFEGIGDRVAKRLDGLKEQF